MKAESQSNIKEYFWYTFKKITNSFSQLIVKSLGNGYIKCTWEIGKMDSLKIKFSKTFFYAIRIFDVTNNRNKNYSTCIMKEMQVNQFQSSLSFPIPVNKGVYCFEFGYRKRNGEWRALASKNLNLGYRIKNSIQRFGRDNWFLDRKSHVNLRESFHEKSYQLSLNNFIGGSENTFIDL